MWLRSFQSVSISHIPLSKWLLAAWLMASSKK
jgi:hypothetical protein